MTTFIARQPIMDSEHKLAAYEIIYNPDGSAMHSPTDAKVANAIMAFFTQPGSAGFYNDKECFLTFTPNLLMQNVPTIFDKTKLIIQFDDSSLINPAASSKLNEFGREGYRLALSGFEFSKRHIDMLSSVEMIKFDLRGKTDEELDRLCLIAKQFGLKLFAYGIHDEKTERTADEYGFDYMQGSYIGRAESSQVKSMDHMQSTFLRMLSEITKPEPNVDELAKLISMDVSLSYALLKMVNSAYFSLANKIKDVKQALMVIGLNRVRQWLYLLSFTPDGGRTDELIKVSFQRAVFCENLAPLIRSKRTDKSEAYLTGMFSTLGELLGVSPADAVKDLPISDDIKKAFDGEENEFYLLVKLCENYENGLWHRMGECAERLAISEELIGQKYIESVNYVAKMLGDLMDFGNR